MSNVPAKSELPYVEWVDETGNTGRIYADVPVTEEIVSPALATQNPVEEGSTVTDHYRKENDTIAVELFFSDSPIRYDLTDVDSAEETVTLNIPEPPGAPIFTPGGATQALVGAIGNLISGGPKVPKVKVRKFSRPLDRASKAFEQLRLIQSKGWLANIRTTTMLYENCAITEAKLTRSKSTGDGSTITLALQQLRFVKSDVTIAVPLPSEPRAQKRKKPKDEGAKDVSDSGGASLAKQLLNGAGVTTPGGGL